MVRVVPAYIYILYAAWPIPRSSSGQDRQCKRTSMRVIQAISYGIAIERSRSRASNATSGGRPTVASIMIEISIWCKCGRITNCDHSCYVYSHSSSFARPGKFSTEAISRYIFLPRLSLEERRQANTVIWAPFIPQHWAAAIRGRL